METQEINSIVERALSDKPLEQFRTMLATFFKDNQPKVPPTKRPRLAIRLGDFVFKPLWKRSLNLASPSMSVSKLDCETITVENEYLCLKLEPCKAKWTKFEYHHGPETTNQLSQLVEEFINEPWKSFCQSRGNCCVCKKELTDPVSQARGIGPECWGKITRWLTQIKNSRP